MSLTKAEKACILSLWSKISSQREAIGAETMERLFTAYPQAKTYFPHFNQYTDSAELRTHGSKVMGAVGDAVNSIDNIPSSLSKLSELHAYNLRVDPVNFKFLSQSMLVTLAANFPDYFPAETQAAWDKFLATVSSVLTEKYR